MLAPSRTSLPSLKPQRTRGGSRVPWWLSPKKIATRIFEARHTKPFEPTLTAIGDYYLDALRLDRRSVVYSLGVGTQIEFDLALTQLIGCDVWMFDPTPRSWDFMNGHHENPKLRYEPIGVWTADGVAKFHHERRARQTSQVGNASIINLFGRDDYFEAPVQTLGTIMSNHGHDHIDVLKANIEGAALPVLEQAVKNDTLADQIVVHLERPRQWKDMRRFFRRVSRLFAQLRARGYRVIRLPRSARYDSLEVLALQKKAKEPTTRPAAADR